MDSWSTATAVPGGGMDKNQKNVLMLKRTQNIFHKLIGLRINVFYVKF